MKRLIKKKRVISKLLILLTFLQCILIFTTVNVNAAFSNGEVYRMVQKSGSYNLTELSDGNLMMEYKLDPAVNCKQFWSVAYVSNGYYRITSSSDYKVLDVQWGSTSPGAKIQVYTDNSSDAQLWKIIDVGSGYYRIQPKLNSSLALTGGGRNAGLTQQTYSGIGSDYQLWKLESLTSSNYDTNHEGMVSTIKPMSLQQNNAFATATKTAINNASSTLNNSGWGTFFNTNNFYANEPNPRISDDNTNVILRTQLTTNDYLMMTAQYYNVEYGWWYYSRGTDIDINTAYAWGDASGNANVYDVQGCMIHELTHVLGMSDMYDANDIPLTMYGYGYKGETYKRTLDVGDRNGIDYLY